MDFCMVISNKKRFFGCITQLYLKINDFLTVLSDRVKQKELVAKTL